MSERLSVSINLEELLKDYKNSLQHKIDCGACSEGLTCCLDPNHPKFAQLKAVLEVWRDQ